jgi:hypothetical protein
VSPKYHFRLSTHQFSQNSIWRPDESAATSAALVFKIIKKCSKKEPSAMHININKLGILQKEM